MYTILRDFPITLYIDQYEVLLCIFAAYTVYSWARYNNE